MPGGGISRWILVLGAAVLFGALAACAPAEPQPGATTKPREVPGKPPRYGGTLLFASPSRPTSLNYYKHSDAFGAEAWTPVYEGLLSFDYKVGEDFRKELRLVPFLAEKWEQPDQTTYLFHLRKGVKWHDGQELTADDVVFSLEYLRDPKNAFPKSSYLAAADKIEKVDKYLVRITTKAPTASFTENLAQREAVILPKHVIDGGGSFDKLSGAIGTGPLRVTFFDSRTKTTYARFDDYWRGKPYLDGLEALYGLDSAGRLAAFVANKVDIGSIVEKPNFDEVMARVKGVQGEGFPTSHGMSLYLRVDRPPLSDVRVRRAIHLALDRQAMEKVLAFGLGTINPPAVSGLHTWVIPQEELLKLPGYRQPKDQDLAEAKKLLAEAGYGQGLSISIEAVGVWSNFRVAEMAAQPLKAVGIDVELKPLESGIYFKNQAEGNFQIAVNGMGVDFMDSSLSAYYYGKGKGNPGRISDPELDRLIEKHRSTFDREQRIKVLLDIQRFLLDKLYTIPTVEFSWFWVQHPYVRGFVNPRSTTAALYRFGEIWFDEGAPQR